uniref:Uncharacterized protein n=1 Tax=Gelidium gabrielsonii TaxID=2483892 RepID=A0A3G2QXH4_9FLOR|nr:hypothetical protein [Gelidium gabrielsonii]AYO27752.1 hypothetical protein [Gelidium gabrielsonii]
MSSTGREYSAILATTNFTALSIPFLKIIGLAPAATFFKPCFTIACARTVAVVVPSPATSFVFDAACLISATPVFSIEFFNSISFAIVTPSLTICGEPNFLSKTTLRPLGPSVTDKASAKISIPFSKALRALS